MITADFSGCKTLSEFYDSIKAKHQEAHGDDYTAHHNEMTRLIREENLTAYRELGVMQGATAACAALAGAKILYLVDINLDRFHPYKHLFKDYTLFTDEKSSINFTDVNEEVDILLIDSIHNELHVRKELDLFHKSTRRHIIFHDTYSVPSIHKMILKWLKEHPEWELAKYYQINVGFTRITRKQ